MTGSIDEHQLIKLVESHRILYDRRLGRSPQHILEKQRIWQELAAQLNATELTCVRRWRNLRDRFGREYRRLLENPGLETTWPWFPNLLFLKDHYKTGNISTSDVVLQFKYAPKPKKRKLCPANETSNDDVDTDELLFNQQLIGLVKEHPVLYHRQAIRNFKNLTLKNEAWQQISENMGATETLCYERWKLLRDKFARLCRQHQLEPRKPILWAHYRDMLFLKEHYRKGIPLDGSSRQTETSTPAELCADYAIEYDNHEDDALLEFIEAEQSDDESAEEVFEEHFAEYEVVNEQSETVPPPGVNIEDDNKSSGEPQTVAKALATDDAYIEVDIEPTQEFQPILEETAYLEVSNAAKAQHKRVPTEQTETTLEVELLSAGNADNIPTSHSSVDPATKLAQLISSMQTALQESQDCLAALQQQPQAAQVSGTANDSCTDRTMLHKILVLLEGLTPANRLKAEKKMLNFLLECQVRQETNLEIDDVCLYDGI